MIPNLTVSYQPEIGHPVPPEFDVVGKRYNGLSDSHDVAKHPRLLYITTIQPLRITGFRRYIQLLFAATIVEDDDCKEHIPTRDNTINLACGNNTVLASLSSLDW